MSSWEPNASRKLLEIRAALLNKVRSFFLERGVLEVETPLLASSSITDPNIEVFETQAEQKKYLQTSPEYAMKRLFVQVVVQFFRSLKPLGVRRLEDTIIQNFPF